MTKKGLPLHLIFFVTSKCNSRCKHCFYWKRQLIRQNELDISEIEKISKRLDSILWLQITGGEPFLRKDIVEIIKIFYNNNKPQNISINTDGYLKDVIYSKLVEILEICKKSYLSLSISLDGLRQTHDRIRRNRGSFDRAIETFDSLKILKRRFSNFGLNIVTTYSPYNQKEIFELYDFIKGHRPDFICVNLIRGKPRDSSLAKIDIEGYKKINNLITKDIIARELPYYNFPLSKIVLAQILLQKDIIAKIYEHKKYILPCYAGRLSAVLYENGDIYPCELLDKKIGNIRESNYNFKKIWNTDNARKLRRYIILTKCRCTHECNLTANILFNPVYSLKLLRLLRQL